MNTITWFSTSPSAGDPTCLCSWCEEPIGEEDAPVLRMFDQASGREARFHRRCFGAAAGITIGSGSEDAAYEEEAL